MVLSLVGLGLYGLDNITAAGEAAIQSADVVYLEAYTAVLGASKDALEAYHNKVVIEADRRTVELQSDEIIEKAKTQHVAFLVVGDPLCATTHCDLYLRAVQQNVKVTVIHNASIMNAISSTGLQLYRFGECISIPYFDSPGLPNSYYDKIVKNSHNNLHTLCLLDIRVKEQKIENLMRGNDVFEAPKYMTVNEAISQLLTIEELLNKGVCRADTKAVGVARLGSEDQTITAGTLQELLTYDFGLPLHSLVVCAPELHAMEEEFYILFSSANQIAKE